MHEVMPNLWVGGADAEAEVRDNPNWYIISAARDPWHRQALGYAGRGAPKEHLDYLVALREGRMILNLVDVADPAYIRDEIMDGAVQAIHDMIDRPDGTSPGRRVLIHCNQGKSRSPTIAMLYMAKHGQLREMLPFEVIEAFKRIYPDYAPAEGMRLYAQRWLSKMAAAA